MEVGDSESIQHQKTYFTNVISTTNFKGLYTLVLIEKIENFFIALSESTHLREFFSKKSYRSEQ